MVHRKIEESSKSHGGTPSGHGIKNIPPVNDHCDGHPMASIDAKMSRVYFKY